MMRDGSKRRNADADAVMLVLRAVVRASHRCPTKAELRFQMQRQGYAGVAADATVTALARRGFLQVEIWEQNWRVIEIDGRRSAESPYGTAPKQRIGRPATMRAA